MSLLRRGVMDIIEIFRQSAARTVVFYAIAFAVITVIAFALKRSGAFRFARSMVRASIANMSLVVINLAIVPALYWSFPDVSAWLSASGVPQTPAAFWEGLHPAASLVGYLLAYDFVDYWTHRARHTLLLWPVHAVHHADTHLNFTSTQRQHAIEVFAVGVQAAVVGHLVNATAFDVALVILFVRMHPYYMHADLNISHGPFELIFASPQFHRWHHADVPEAWNKNFAFRMPIWDKLFGTYYNPGPCRAPTGFQGGPGEDVPKLLIYPFAQWIGMARRALSRSRRVKAATSGTRVEHS